MKKVLKQQAKELEAYVKARHTQEECIGFIDGFERANELFALYNVSQQRELLVAYEKNHYTPQEWALASKQCIEDIDNFLAINCG